MGGMHCGSIGDPHFWAIGDGMFLDGRAHISGVVGASCVRDANYLFRSIIQGGILIVRGWTDMITN
eukprot:7630593-Ditylum_brightwellii.AAC.1